MSIIIGADIVPTGADVDLFSNGAAVELIGNELLEILQNSSYRIFNLEVPLTDVCQPIRKYGPHLIASTSTVQGIQSLGINLLTLANNHIMDQDTQGIASTIRVLDDAGIAYVGAGQNLNEAQQPYFLELQGKRYGIYACAEHEFSIAEVDKPGANPFDPLESLDHIAQMKSECDYAIVLYHGGKEQYRYPSPNLQKTCRKLIEKGADLVVCQHSHCIGCKEEYKNGTIVYGQGNFLFNKKNNEYWNTGLLIELQNTGSISYIPFIRKEQGIRIAEGREADEILVCFEKRSKEIEDPSIVEKKYEAFANESIPGYVLFFLGINNSIIYRFINRMSGQRLRRYISNRVLKKRGDGIRNYIECEAHKELILKGINVYNE